MAVVDGQPGKIKFIPDLERRYITAIIPYFSNFIGTTICAL